MKFINIVISVLLINLTGCATGSDLARKQTMNTKSGYIYGVYLENGGSSTKQICDAIKNNDIRCNDADNYKNGGVVSQVKFSTGAVGSIFLVDKNIDIGRPCTSGSPDCTYLKVKVEAGKLGTIVGVVSRPNDGICIWSGLPRAGGVVCKSLSWDYRRDSDAAVEF